uniref:Uncharacterized protein n=1 Tax=viral metagenome TaxID=1070528 RepID=A0A6C0LZR0_9ZZZZ
MSRFSLSEMAKELLIIQEQDAYYGMYDFYMESGRHSEQEAMDMATRAFNEHIQLKIDEEKRRVNRMKSAEIKAHIRRVAIAVEKAAQARQRANDVRGTILLTSLEDLIERFNTMQV